MMTTLEKAARARAHKLANDMARHIMGVQFSADDETCRVCIEMATEAFAAERAALSAALLDPSDEVVAVGARELARRTYDSDDDNPSFCAIYEGQRAQWEEDFRAALRAAGVKITGGQG